jgi:hypothetical protein
MGADGTPEEERTIFAWAETWRPHGREQGLGNDYEGYRRVTGQADGDRADHAVRDL